MEEAAAAASSDASVRRSKRARVTMFNLGTIVISAGSKEPGEQSPNQPDHNDSLDELEEVRPKAKRSRAAEQSSAQIGDQSLIVIVELLAQLHPTSNLAILDTLTPSINQESRKASVDIFLKAAGYLDCVVRHVLPQMSNEVRRNLPVDLAEGVLRALSLQALRQVVDIQLGMTLDSTKATLAVKRSKCEMIKYWQQAQDNIMKLPLTNGWGEKHKLYIKWEYVIKQRYLKIDRL